LRLSEFSVVGGRTIRIRTVCIVRTAREKGTEIEAGLDTVFEEFLLLLARTEQFVQQAVGTVFEVQFLGGPYNSTDLA
jgi:hypothetical protein